jgi:hypothetical protein
MFAWPLLVLYIGVLARKRGRKSALPPFSYCKASVFVIFGQKIIRDAGWGLPSPSRPLPDLALQPFLLYSNQPYPGDRQHLSRDFRFTAKPLISYIAHVARKDGKVRNDTVWSSRRH